MLQKIQGEVEGKTRIYRIKNKTYRQQVQIKSIHDKIVEDRLMVAISTSNSEGEAHKINIELERNKTTRGHNTTTNNIMDRWNTRRSGKLAHIMKEIAQ